MRFEFPVAIFTIGAFLVLVGLVGGDLSYRGLTVPKVGVLPRFTATVTGGAFLAMSLVVFLVIEFGHDPPAAAADPVVSVSSEPVVDPAGEAVTISFNDTLTEGAFQEDIDVSVDGSHAGTLHADVDATSSSIDISVEQGEHSYTLIGLIETEGGDQIPVTGEGTFQADAGSSFDLTVSDSGELGLSRRT
ncbi:MAG TPA: hypothetical protein VGC06_06910 [Actinomycetes bacterium]